MPLHILLFSVALTQISSCLHLIYSFSLFRICLIFSLVSFSCFYIPDTSAQFGGTIRKLHYNHKNKSNCSLKKILCFSELLVLFILFLHGVIGSEQLNLYRGDTEAHDENFAFCLATSNPCCTWPVKLGVDFSDYTSWFLDIIAPACDQVLIDWPGGRRMKPWPVDSSDAQELMCCQAHVLHQHVFISIMWQLFSFLPVPISVWGFPLFGCPISSV